MGLGDVSLLWALAPQLAVLIVYLWAVNSSMKQVPPEALKKSPHRWTSAEIRATYDRLKEEPIDFGKLLPAQLHRRYVIVGGAGLVGGDIVLQLLRRGQSPESIRIVDFQPLNRKDMLEHASGCDYVKADITSLASVESAFSKPWPKSVAHLPLTVFHTAAAIRYGERSLRLYNRVARVNKAGTANVLSAARSVGKADIFIATSSSSVAYKPASLWSSWWPFKTPENYYQVLSESDFDAPLRPHNQFFGNYGYAKAEAERLVCAANDPSNFRTGVIRPGNGIYGQIGDVIVGAILKMGQIISWTPNVIQNSVNSRNVALAHLQFEAALATSPSDNPPKCAGRPYLVTDPGPAICFKDLHKAVKELAVTPKPMGEVYPPPVVMLLVAQAIEAWSLLLDRLPFLTSVFGWKEPSGDLAQLQPAVFTASAFMICDDSAARRSVEKGGLGYRRGCNTLEGICMQVLEWNREQEEEARGGKKSGSVSVSEKVAGAKTAPGHVVVPA